MIDDELPRVGDSPPRANQLRRPTRGPAWVGEEAMTRCPICNTDNGPSATICRACGASLAGDPAGGYTAALRPGTQLDQGRYAVGKVLGQGGFGITYLGSDAQVRRPVAIKEFFPQGSARDGQDVRPSRGLTDADYASTRTKFLDEAHILAQFNDPGI